MTELEQAIHKAFFALKGVSKVTTEIYEESPTYIDVTIEMTDFSREARRRVFTIERHMCKLYPSVWFGFKIVDREVRNS